MFHHILRLYMIEGKAKFWKEGKEKKMRPCYILNQLFILNSFCFLKNHVMQSSKKALLWSLFT